MIVVPTMKTAVRKENALKGPGRKSPPLLKWGGVKHNRVFLEDRLTNPFNAFMIILGRVSIILYKIIESPLQFK